MLVTCANCKSPVFVSAVAVASGATAVGCASCGATLAVASSGDARLVGAPPAGAAEPAGLALPSYEGGAAGEATAATSEPDAPASTPPRATAPGAATHEPEREPPPAPAGFGEDTGPIPTAAFARSAEPATASAPEVAAGAGELFPPLRPAAAGPAPDEAPTGEVAIPPATSASTASPEPQPLVVSAPRLMTPPERGPVELGAAKPHDSAASGGLFAWPQSPASAALAAATASAVSPGGDGIRASEPPGGASLAMPAPPAETPAPAEKPAPLEKPTRPRTDGPAASAPVDRRAPAAGAPSRAAGAGERIPHFLSSVPAARASDAPRLGPEPRPDAARRGAAEASPAAARRRAFEPPEGRPGEPVTMFPPSRPGAPPIVVVGAGTRAGPPRAERPPVPRAAAMAPAQPRQYVRFAASKPRRPARVVVAGSLGLVAAALVGWWALGRDAGGSRGAPVPPPPAGASAMAARPGGAAREQALGHYRQANALIAQNKGADAVAELRACVALAPDLAVAYRSLGIAYMQVGREPSAIEAYERFVQLEPRHRDAESVRRIIEAYRKRTAGH